MTDYKITVESVNQTFINSIRDWLLAHLPIIETVKIVITADGEEVYKAEIEAD